MESRWRYNVSWMGLTGDVYGLIARLRSNPTVAITNYPGFAPEIATSVYNPSGGTTWGSYFQFTKPNPFVGFPYGFDVEPDRPV